MKSAVFGMGALLAMSFLPRSASAKTPGPGPVSLTVSVFNDAGAWPAVLSRARSRAVEVMRNAGIDLLWVDCGTPGHWVPNSGCTAIDYPRHLSVRIVTRPSGRSEDTFGESFENAEGEGNYALIYFAVLERSPAGSLGTGELLGLVVAHELGHLLLGRNSHSASGLMSPVWQALELSQAERGGLLFSGRQAEQMRSRYLLAAARHGDGRGSVLASSGK